VDESPGRVSATLMSNDERFAELSRRCRAAGQDHLLHFWPELADAQRRELLDDLERIDFARR
jgi:hypothetical protein